MVVAAFFLTSLVVWSHRDIGPKLAAIGLSVVLMGSGYLGFVELLSRPKPTTMEWAQDATQNATVLSVNMREDEVIYLWLVPAGTKEPRSYAMPWNKQRAQQLDSVMRQAQEEGAGFSRQVQHLMFSRNASAGVLYPRHFLGVELTAHVISSISRAV